MSGDKLTPLQWRILQTLAGLAPRWTLTGGAALSGVHLNHRTTRDLDLFWRGRADLGDIPRLARTAMAGSGLAVESLQSEPSFCRLRVIDGTETCIVDLVAEPFESIEAPLSVETGGVFIHVDSQHEILVSKLCALLSRSELRDLMDIRAIIGNSGSLERALADAPKKDSGFSPLTLAWVLREFDVETLGSASGWPAEETAELRRFKEELTERILSLGAPG